MKARTRIASFRGAAARDRYFDVYDRAIASGPPARETHDVDTAFGTVRVYRHGPDHGAPIVLLHAYSATAAMWAPNITALAQRHPVYAIDALAQPGASVQTAPIRTGADCAAWLDDALARLGLSDVHLVGCSSGGWLAFNQSVRAPDRIATMVLVEPANVLARFTARFTFCLATLAPGMPRSITRRAVARALGSPSVDDPMHAVVELIVAGARDCRAFGIGPGPRYPSDDVLKSVRIPVLALLGERSLMHDAARAAARARNLLAAAEVECWPAATHGISGEIPNEINTRILEFIATREHK